MPPTPPASPFAALLRRSKFASFDPQVGQVYASFGGDLHRGNWGLKRPLPLRRRNAHVTLSSVDSREQQTEWSSAEAQSRWIRMWDEVGVTPTIGEGSPWEMKMGPLAEVTWMTDSEFGGDKEKEFGAKLEGVARQQGAKGANAGNEGTGTRKSLVAEAAALGVHAPNLATANILAMSPKEFEVYLRNLRKLRPTFKRFLEVKSAVENPHVPPKSTWERSQMSSEDYTRFLSGQTHVKYEAPDAHVLEQQPHNSGGLMYAKTPHLQTYLLNKPQPGRIIRTRTTSTRGTYGYAVAFAGQNTILDKVLIGKDQEPMNWDDLARYGIRDPTQGSGLFKLVKTKLVDSPSVVGTKPGGLSKSVVVSDVRSWEEKDESRPNPHWPGSREYVGKNELVITTGLLKVSPALLPKKVQPKFTSKQVLDTLVVILARDKSKREGGASHVS